MINTGLWFGAVMACNMMATGCLINPVAKTGFQTQAECEKAIDGMFDGFEHDSTAMALLMMPSGAFLGGCLYRDTDWKFSADVFYKRFAPNAPRGRFVDAALRQD